MRCKFPYFEDRPHIPLVLEYEGKRARFLPLLDTGADFSVFYKADALRLGLDWEKGIAMDLDNADGSPFRAKQFTLKIEIEGYAFNGKMCFVDSKKSAMPLLGRRDIFKHFDILIREEKGYVEFKSLR